MKRSSSAVGPVADPQVAGVAQRGPGPHRDRALGQAGDNRALVGVAEVQPGEVGLALGVGEAELVEGGLDPDPLDDRRLDPAGDVVAVQEGLGAGGLGERVDAERLAHRVDRGAEVRRAERGADPQPGQAVALAEGAQDDQVGDLGEQVDRRVGIVVRLELDVGLVEDHRHPRRHLLEEGGDRGGRVMRPGRVVRVADDQQLGRRGHLGGHRVEVVDVALAERHADLTGAGQRRQVGVDRERGPGVDDLRPGLAERLGGGKQDLAGPVADRDPAGLGLVALGESLAQEGRVGVRVAVHRPGGALDRLDDLRVRRKGRLVGGQLGDLAAGDLLGRLPGRDTGLVARNPGELLGEGDCHGAFIVAYGSRGGRSRLLRGVQIGAQLLRRPDVDVLRDGCPRGRSSGPSS